MSVRLKVPAKNSPALLFLSRGKEEERKTTTISCFYPAEEEQSRLIFGGNFQTRAHDGDKAAGLKVTTCVRLTKLASNNLEWIFRIHSTSAVNIRHTLVI